LKTGSCVHFTDHKLPSLLFSNDIEEFLDISKQSSVTWVNYPVDDVRKDSAQVATSFGFGPTMIERLFRGRYSSFVDDDKEIGIMVPAVLVEGSSVKPHIVLLLIRDGLMLSIHDRHVTRFARFIRYAEIFIKKIPSDWSKIDQLTNILLRLIDENNRRNFLSIKLMTGEVDNLQRAFANEHLSITKIAAKIQRLRHILVQLLSVLWENYDIMRNLQQGDTMLLSTRPELLERFNKIRAENSTYIQLGENLANIIGSGSEAMQDYYQIRLLRMNNVLSFTCTWLGILGTIFLVPNTIATAMSASSFPLGPDDAWWYSILLISATVVSSVITYIVLRKLWGVTKADIDRRRLVIAPPIHR
jgi:Mg2+ and Co2+ transporter CorA